jgi:hypothetical protein
MKLFNKKSKPDAIIPLTSEQWAKHYNPSQLESLVDNLSHGHLSWQTREMLTLSKPGETLLEIGSGSSETSLYLALNGRNCTALDFAQPCLELAQQAALRLNCLVKTVCADATRELPFAVNEFDMVFQAGLLEHFQKHERISLLRLWGKIGKRMVSMIPNAASLSYRFGKALMEKAGTWEYGLELPQYSLQQEFADAGFRVVEEYTIGEEHSLGFLPAKHYLRIAIEKWIEENPCNDNCGQGYLLVTIGDKI